MASTKPRLQTTPPTPTKPEPVEYRVVTICGVDYFIDWGALKPGASFFLPTVATPVQVRNTLTPIAKALGIYLEVRPRVEYGRYGSRVWRVD